MITFWPGRRFDFIFLLRVCSLVILAKHGFRRTQRKIFNRLNSLLFSSSRIVGFDRAIYNLLHFILTIRLKHISNASILDSLFVSLNFSVCRIVNDLILVSVTNERISTNGGNKRHKRQNGTRFFRCLNESDS